MARPKSISWETRVAIFLAYRATGGKVNPVAVKYGVARSSVRSIVKEFVDMDFSEQPRAKVSAQWLSELQDQHLAGLVSSSGLGFFQAPGTNVGMLNLGPGTDNEAARQEAMADPLPISEESWWHLKGTRAEEVIQEAIVAARDFLQQESDAWKNLRRDLEEKCQLTEIEIGVDEAEHEPHIFPVLKQKVHNAFTDKEFKALPPPPEWLQWDIAPDKPKVLRLRGQPIGRGSEESLEEIKDGVTAFLADGFKKHQKRFFEVSRLRRDMLLMQGIVNKTLESVTDEEIRLGICPTCPYPEAKVEITTVRRTRTPRLKEDA